MDSDRRCLVCERRLILEHHWRAMSAEAKATAKHTGRAAHRCRGLCTRCHDRAAAAGTLEDFPRINMAGPDVLAEWEWLHEAGELRSSDSRAQRIRQAAPRIGLSEEALDAALWRAERTAA